MISKTYFRLKEHLQNTVPVVPICCVQRWWSGEHMFSGAGGISRFTGSIDTVHHWLNMIFTVNRCQMKLSREFPVLMVSKTTLRPSCGIKWSQMAIVLRKNPWFSIAKWNSLWDSLALLHNQKHLRYPTHITPCQRKNTTAATSPPIHTRRPEWPWGSRCLHIYILLLLL